MRIFSLQAKTETEGYEPWTNFTNTALRLLKTKRVAGLRERNTDDDIIMQRTDPFGTVAGRKPDITFLKLRRAQALRRTRDDWDMIAEACAAAKPLPGDERSNHEHTDRGPEDAGLPYFDWPDVLFFSEHKFTKHSPKSLSFEDLLILEKLRAPGPPSPPGQSFPTYDIPPIYLTLSPQCLLKAKSEASMRFWDLAPVQDAPVSTCWCNVCYFHLHSVESQKTRADGTASSSSKNSQHSSPSHTIAEDGVFVSTEDLIVEGGKLFAVQAGEYGFGCLNSWFSVTHSLGCLVLGESLCSSAEASP